MMDVERLGGIQLVNGDCMDVMRELPDNAFDLAICDPPYGIGIDGQKQCICKNPKHNRKQHAQKDWDKLPPQKRISENWNGYHETKSFGARITLFRA